MSDEEFSAFLIECRSELASRQAGFQNRIKDCPKWFYDLKDCTLRMGDHLFPITPIGTYSSEYKTWLWAWANEDFPEKARETSKRLQELHTATGFQVFLDRGIAASLQDALDFSAMAARCVGAIGIFRVPGAPELFFAVHQPAESIWKRLLRKMRLAS